MLPSPPFPKSSAPNLSNSSVSVQTAAAEDTKPPARPRLSYAIAGSAVSFPEGRRPSIQFAPSVDTTARTPKPKLPPAKLQRRFSSPPPPSIYESRVSFDTFDNRDATDISFTLISKHKDFDYSRRSRTFLCGTDQNDYSEFALEWLMEELVEDGDEIICLRVVDKDSKISSNASVEQGIYKSEARNLLQRIQAKNVDNKAINLVLDLAIGKVPDTIQRMIKIYEPACLIVGTRGRSLGGIQGLLPGSVSKYCLQNSPVPVIVVRPEDKREKKKQKRLADPSRQTYSSILDQSNASGVGAFDTLARQSGGKASENEAAAVAKAIGLKEGSTDWKWRGFQDEGENDLPEFKVSSEKSDSVIEPESPSPTGPLTMAELFPGDLDNAELESLVSTEDGDETGEEEEGEEDGATKELEGFGTLNLAEQVEEVVRKGKEKEEN